LLRSGRKGERVGGWMSYSLLLLLSLLYIDTCNPSSYVCCCLVVVVVVVDDRRLMRIAYSPLLTRLSLYSSHSVSNFSSNLFPL